MSSKHRQQRFSRSKYLLTNTWLYLSMWVPIKGLDTCQVGFYLFKNREFIQWCHELFFHTFLKFRPIQWLATKHPRLLGLLRRILGLFCMLGELYAPRRCFLKILLKECYLIVSVYLWMTGSFELNIPAIVIGRQYTLLRSNENSPYITSEANFINHSTMY